MENKIWLRNILKQDIENIAFCFNSICWNKPIALFEEYLREQEFGERLVWVVYIYDQFAGYVTLKWQSLYPYFKEQNIPEIMDLNVLPKFRKMGIGSLLLDKVESSVATKSSKVGIGVGLYAGSDGGYGAAQRLYVKRGYVPDGKGVTHDYEQVIPGGNYRIDDDLVLWFTKELI